MGAASLAHITSSGTAEAQTPPSESPWLKSGERHPEDGAVPEVTVHQQLKWDRSSNKALMLRQRCPLEARVAPFQTPPPRLRLDKEEQLCALLCMACGIPHCLVELS